MKKVVFTLIGILFALLSSAQESQEVYTFLRLPVSAHAAALGHGASVLHGVSVPSIWTMEV